MTLNKFPHWKLKVPKTLVPFLDFGFLGLLTQSHKPKDFCLGCLIRRLKPLHSVGTIKHKALTFFAYTVCPQHKLDNSQQSDNGIFDCKFFKTQEAQRNSK